MLPQNYQNWCQSVNKFCHLELLGGLQFESSKDMTFRGVPVKKIPLYDKQTEFCYLSIQGDAIEPGDHWALAPQCPHVQAADGLFVHCPVCLWNAHRLLITYKHCPPSLNGARLYIFGLDGELGMQKCYTFWAGG